MTRRQGDARITSFGLYRCGCTTAEEDRNAIPDECTHHDNAPLLEVAAPGRDGPVWLGHSCWLADPTLDSPASPLPLRRTA